MFKEIQVTDHFYGIDESVRKCQPRNLFEECIKNSHVERIRKSCGCLPLALQLNRNVKFNNVFIFTLILNNLGDYLFKVFFICMSFAKEFYRMQKV